MLRKPCISGPILRSSHKRPIGKTVRYLYVQKRGGLSLTLDAAGGDGHGVRGAQGLEMRVQQRQETCLGFHQLWLGITFPGRQSPPAIQGKRLFLRSPTATHPAQPKVTNVCMLRVILLLRGWDLSVRNKYPLLETFI